MSPDPADVYVERPLSRSGGDLPELCRLDAGGTVGLCRQAGRVHGPADEQLFELDTQMAGTRPGRHRAPADEDGVGDAHRSPRNELERHAHAVPRQLEPWPRGTATAADIHEPR